MKFKISPAGGYPAERILIIMIGSKEFYDMIKNFENNENYLPYGVSFEKENEDIWKEGQIYQDGKTNNLFKCFMLGCQFGKIYYR